MTHKVMFQGTSSGAGKTTLAALLCRHLAQEGAKVAPFKALNLSLNSFVTSDGKEIGIAQAFQALAAGVEPRVEMNPILLKPSGDGTMQLVLEGRPFMELCRGAKGPPKEELTRSIKGSIGTLEMEFDALVIEGSGSPVEINLRNRDLANMRTAELAHCPVILVGDIDKGGVFAGLYGTYHLLKAKHRKMLRGFIINRFRGDSSILRPGIEEIERRMRIPCLGVVPMVEVHLPGEDSLALRNGKGRQGGAKDARKAWMQELDRLLQSVRKDLDMDGVLKVMRDGL